MYNLLSNMIISIIYDRYIILSFIVSIKILLLASLRYYLYSKFQRMLPICCNILNVPYLLDLLMLPICWIYQMFPICWFFALKINSSGISFPTLLLLCCNNMKFSMSLFIELFFIPFFHSTMLSCCH